MQIRNIQYIPQNIFRRRFQMFLVNNQPHKPHTQGLCFEGQCIDCKQDDILSTLGHCRNYNYQLITSIMDKKDFSM